MPAPEQGFDFFGRHYAVGGNRAMLGDNEGELIVGVGIVEGRGSGRVIPPRLPLLRLANDVSKVFLTKERLFGDDNHLVEAALLRRALSLDPLKQLAEVRAVLGVFSFAPKDKDDDPVACPAWRGADSVDPHVVELLHIADDAVDVKHGNISRGKTPRGEGETPVAEEVLTDYFANHIGGVHLLGHWVLAIAPLFKFAITHAIILSASLLLWHTSILHHRSESVQVLNMSTTYAPQMANYVPTPPPYPPPNQGCQAMEGNQDPMSTWCRNLLLGAVILGVLLLMVMVAYYHTNKMRHHGHHSKNHFSNKVGVRKHNNLTTGGMNSHWWHGSGDAGHGGSMHRNPTAIHNAIHAPHKYREGLVSNSEFDGTCKPGETLQTTTFPEHKVLVGYGPNPTNPDNMDQPIYKIVPASEVKTCVTSYKPVEGSSLGDDDGLGSDPDGSTYTGPGGCPPWGTEALAEAQALGGVGGFQGDNAYGERRLQRAFGLQITDDQLNAIMHN